MQKMLFDQLMTLMFPMFPKYPFGPNCDENLVMVVNKTMKYYQKCLLVSKENYEMSKLILNYFFLEILHRYYITPLMEKLNRIAANSNFEIIENYKTMNKYYFFFDCLVCFFIFILTMGVILKEKNEIFSIRESIRFNDYGELMWNKEVEKIVRNG